MQTSSAVSVPGVFCFFNRSKWISLHSKLMFWRLKVAARSLTDISMLSWLISNQICFGLLPPCSLCWVTVSVCLVVSGLLISWLQSDGFLTASLPSAFIGSDSSVFVVFSFLFFHFLSSYWKLSFGSDYSSELSRSLTWGTPETVLLIRVQLISARRVADREETIKTWAQPVFIRPAHCCSPQTENTHLQNRPEVCVHACTCVCLCVSWLN